MALPCIKKKVKLFELQMINLATEGCYESSNLLDELLDRAKNHEGGLDQILNAKNEQGDNVIQLSGRYGNPKVLLWYLELLKEKEISYDIDALDSDGATPLFACCQFGYIGAELLHAKTPLTKNKRLETLKILQNEGADVNFKIADILMTPLHWAAYNDDQKAVFFLVNKGAIMTFNRRDNMPVDIAGYCGHEQIVNLFAERVELDLESFVANKEDYQAASRRPILNLSTNTKIAPQFNPADDQKGELAKLTPEEQNNGIITIKLNKVVRKEVFDLRERSLIRVCYWAAFYGRISTIEILIQQLRWSPFIKGYRKQNILTAAVRGNQTEVVKYICSFKYTTDGLENQRKLENSKNNKDDFANTVYHYAYLNDNKEIREYLKLEKIAHNRVRNMRGYLPKQLRHQQKIDSDDSEDAFQKAKSELTNAVLGLDASGAYISSSSTSSEEEALKDESERKPQDVDDQNETRKAKRKKKALYKHADYCFVTKNDTLPILKQELDPLVRKGGVYYDVFDKHEEEDKKIIVVYFEDGVIDFMAEILGVQTRMNQFDCMMPFKCFAADHFERFNSRQLQSIIQQTFQSEFDLAYLEKSKVILDHFPLHGHDRKQINDSWDKYKWRLAMGFITGSWEDDLQPISFIADYYGEKFGFYFAWLVHYTGWLLMPAIGGLFLFLFQLFSWLYERNYVGCLGKGDIQSLDVYDPCRRTFLQAFDTKGNIWFSIFIAIWCTMFVESWKRKENMIANKWLMRDFQDATTERSEFRASIDVDRDTKSIWKVTYTTTRFRQVFVGFPVTLFFIALVIATQICMRSWYLSVTENETKTDISIFVKYAPAFVNASLLIIFETVFKYVAFWLSDGENHRYTQSYENSLVNKIFMFQFINAYISNCIYAFWAQQQDQLANNLITILVFKQIAKNIVEYLQYRVINGYKINKINNVYKQKLDVENDQAARKKLQLHAFIEEQLCMKTERDTLVFFYNEAVIQLGFLILFSPAFPMASLFSVITNLLEIKSRLNAMGYYSRRFISEGASGIGNWNPILEFLSMVCIPMNIAIIFFPGVHQITCKLSPSQLNGEKCPVDQREVEVHTIISTELQELNADVWSLANIILLCVAVEHVLLFLKTAIATAIADVPKGVVEAEYKRQKIAEDATKRLYQIKVERDIETYDEILAKLQGEMNQKYRAAMWDARQDNEDEENNIKNQIGSESLNLQEAARKYFIDKRRKQQRQIAKSVRQKKKVLLSERS